ncbi:response regulator [Aquabacterium sp.]|uniref:PAS domain-containing hybrid sensor histidine kinase/response regulator n=1 Tax=Aquabacterium sp. TaxID=1872578 RepID=UPI0035B2CF99
MAQVLFEAALLRAQTTNQDLALLADRVSDAVMICDARRCIRWVNPAFSRLTGFSLGESLDQQPEELLSGPHTETSLITRINQTLAQGEAIEELEICQHRKDGEPIWVRRSIHPVLEADNEPVRYVEILRDVRATRLAESEHTRRLQAELGLAAKADFLARMGHAMRSPLNAILGFSQLLDMQDTSALPPALQQQLGHIHTAGRQLLGLLDQALDYAKLNEPAVSLHPQRLGMVRVLREVCATQDELARARHVTVVVDCEPHTVWADAQTTRNILEQLLHNAICASQDGGTVWVRGRELAEDRSGVVDIQDQGSSIDPADLPKLFQPFSQIERAQPRSDGRQGLSLAVAQRMAALMTGRIEVRSTLGEGCTFSLKLPLAEEATHVGQPPAKAAEPMVMLPPLRIVHIEDNPLNRSLVEALFATYPHVRLQSAETASDGLAAIEAMQPDVALVDINLPDGSGLDLCRKLRSMPAFKKLPLIALSGDALPDHIARALQAGFNQYLVKPLQINRLLTILATLPTAQASPPRR